MKVAESPRDAMNVREHDTRNEVLMLFNSTLPLRFWSKVYADPSGCWVWQSGLYPGGYGRFFIDGKDVRAHRLAYERENGRPIPAGLEPDHLCRNRACVRPDHLESVTHQVNTLRGQTIPAAYARRTHCSQGHEYSESNTYTKRNRLGRYCRACRSEYHRRRRQALAEWERLR